MVIDTSTKNESKHGEENNIDDKPFTIMVLGAGRGPLVRASLNAADITNSKVKVGNI